MSEKREFMCPVGMQSDLAGVMRGEYEIAKLKFDEPPVVLDCGANIGAFSVWAQHKWPGCKIIGYEPNPDTAWVFRQNCPDVELHEVALLGGGIPVGPGLKQRPELPETVKLLCGLNCGTNSLYDLGQQTHDVFWHVKPMWTGDLPPCDFMKLDTEGAELAILRDYQHLNRVKGVSLEFHNEGDPWEIGQILFAAGLSCAGFVFWPSKKGGFMKWRRIPSGEASQ